MTHPLTGSWKLVWNENRGVRYHMGHVPTNLSKISMNTLPTYPCIITGLRQRIDVPRKVWIDSLDLVLPDIDSQATWTIFGRLNETPEIELPSMIHVAYDYGRLIVHSQDPGWLVEYADTSMKLNGRGKALTLEINDRYRIDRDMHDRSAYLERTEDTT